MVLEDRGEGPTWGTLAVMVGMVGLLLLLLRGGQVVMEVGGDAGWIPGAAQERMRATRGPQSPALSFVSAHLGGRPALLRELDEPRVGLGAGAGPGDGWGSWIDLDCWKPDPGDLAGCNPRPPAVTIFGW